MSEDYQSGYLPPMLMFRSFLTLAAGIVLHALIMGLTIHLIGMNFFEEYQQAFDQFQALPADLRAEAIRPQDAIPMQMFWIVIAIGTPVNFVLGALTTRTAPFSYMAHSVFLGVLLFVFYLQKSITQEPDEKFMTLVYMTCFSIAIIVGGNWMSRRMMRSPPMDSTDVPSEEPRVPSARDDEVD